MATANIDLTDGTKIVVDGSPDEIARVLQLYRAAPPALQLVELPRHRRNSAAAVEHSVTRKQPSTRGREGAMSHIRALIHEKFFSERRSISDVQAKLEEIGHIYPQTHLSTPLRRLVQSRELRRLKDAGNWVYVQST